MWDPVAGAVRRAAVHLGHDLFVGARAAIAAPISLGIATYLSELCPARLRQPLIFLTELLAAIPSIVYGLWGLFVLVPLVRALETAMPEGLRERPCSAVRRSDSACCRRRSSSRSW